MGDADAIAPNLRQADVDELTAAHGRWTDVRGILRRSICISSSCWTATKDNEPVMLFGVAPVSLLSDKGRKGSPWMLATPEVNHHGKTLVKMGRYYVGKMHEEYDYLMNYVDARNRTSKRWLRRIGFVLYPPEPRGQLNLPFHYFDRRAAHV